MEQPAARNNDEKTVGVVTSSSPAGDLVTADDGLINASGHSQQLDRNFNLLSICSYAITAGNTWVSLGGSIVRPFPSRLIPSLNWVPTMDSDMDN